MTPETPSLSPDPVEIGPNISVDEHRPAIAGPGVHRQEVPGNAEPSFTPGPWRYSETWRPKIGNFPNVPTNAAGEVFWGYAITGSNRHGAGILPTLAAVHNFPDQCLSNARLIAAAPDLFAALRNLLRVCETGFTGWPATFGEVEARDMAIAAIVKAHRGDR